MANIREKFLSCVKESYFQGKSQFKVILLLFPSSFLSVLHARSVLSLKIILGKVHQRIEEHKGPTIGKHVGDQHGRDPSDISLRFKILRKCRANLTA